MRERMKRCFIKMENKAHNYLTGLKDKNFKIFVMFVFKLPFECSEKKDESSFCLSRNKYETIEAIDNSR